VKFQFEPIGTIESCFKEKFGIPRQSGLVKTARATLRLPLPKYRDTCAALEQFSHLWIVFVFHQHSHWNALVRPPRLGGAKKVGVFSSRSPHRPNPIGLSAVRLEKIEYQPREIVLHLLGGDFLDGTPVLDIKPYIRYADSISRASSGWTEIESAPLKVGFSATASRRIRTHDPRGERKLKRLITEIIRGDPRPAFQRQKSEREKGASEYAFRLEEFDVHWMVEGLRAKVVNLKSE
jgi:tRNA-Thr(GGU) m(6)t(6)A37 methyltransferase TsaA